MNNKVISGLGFNDEVRFYIVDSKQLVQTVCDKNKSYPIASTVLGRCISITGLMGLMLKGDSEITTIIEADGPLGKVITIANPKGETRSLVANPQLDLKLINNKLDISGAVGTIGNIKVIKDLKMRDPFVSETSIISGDINMDFTYYFSYSEQTGTAITSGVTFNEDFTINTAGALIVQLLPNASEDTIDKLESVMKSLKPIEVLLVENSLEDILKIVFNDDYRQLKEATLEYKCICNEDRFIDGIRLLSLDEIIDIKKDKFVECTCNFCHTVYNIDTNKI